jgi:hypothetical protein
VRAAGVAVLDVPEVRDVVFVVAHKVCVRLGVLVRCGAWVKRWK